MDSQLAKNLFTENANELSDDFLKIESKNWDSAKWELYLKTLECPIRESLVSEKCFSLALDNGESIFNLVRSEPESNSVGGLNKYMEQLSFQQINVIKFSFEDNLSERQIASRLGVSRSTVKTAKKRAMQKIKSKINFLT